MSALLTKVGIASHVEVVVVNVDDFYRIFVDRCMRRWPADDLLFGVVDRALVVCVVQLGWTNQRIHTWWIDVVSDRLLDHLHVVALNLVKERKATLNRIGSLKRPPDFVVAGRIKCQLVTRGGGAKNWNTSISLVDVMPVFLNLLEVR